MQIISVDTRRVVSKLREKGFTQKQAEGLLEAVQEIDLSNVATKSDVKELHSDMQLFRQEMKSEMQAFKNKMDGQLEGIDKKMDSQFEILKRSIENGHLKVKTDLVMWFMPLILGLYGILVVHFYLR